MLKHKRLPTSNYKVREISQEMKWRRVQDSNLWTSITGHGLAIRCITALPTLQREWLIYTLNFNFFQGKNFTYCLI